MDFVSVISTHFRRVARVSPASWFLVWTAVGGLFSLQLHWHYGLPWSLSVFWGIADWYLWSFLAFGAFALIRKLVDLSWSVKLRISTYICAAPVVAAFHVILTMIVAGPNNAPLDHSLSEYFAALYAKKLTLNVLTFAAIAGIGEWLASRAQTSTPAAAFTEFLAKRGNLRRKIKSEDVIWGEVCGNEVLLHSREGSWSVPLTLTQLLEMLPKQDFLRISRSAVLRLSCVQSMQSSAGKLVVILSDGTQLTVSRRRQAELRSALRSLTQI